MEHYPVFLDLKGRSCLVAGGGATAGAKAADLLRAGAHVTILAGAIEDGARRALDAACTDSGLWRHHPGPYRLGLEAGHALVIAADADPAVTRLLSQACQRRGIPFNAVDQPQWCSYVTPAVVDRSPLLVAISSAGAAPVLARRVRSLIESSLPQAYGRLAAVAGGLRERVRDKLPAFRDRLRFWERAFDGPAAALILAGREAEGVRELERDLQSAVEGSSSRRVGEVYLVGAGPGDPELLTVRAVRLMQQADVVLYDRLIDAAVLERVRKDAERIPVGKARSRHTLTQAAINDLMIERARAGQRVLRLKGGDPYVFGRGAEEASALVAAGVTFQVVPGITAAQGCASYAGIPLTHREMAAGCRFLAGHRADDAWEHGAMDGVSPDETLVVYMPVYRLDAIARRLREAGIPGDQPAALVYAGTRPEQAVVTGTLDNLPERVDGDPDRGPGLLFVGKTVSLQQRLQWYGGDLPVSEESPCVAYK